MTNTRARVLICLAVAIAAPGVWGQSDAGHGSIQGRITDASAKVIQGAEVTLRETRTGYARKLVTDAEGNYRAGALPIGTFSVEATAPGFGSAKADEIAVSVGETKR
jgi:hypothetical protein